MKLNAIIPREVFEHPLAKALKRSDGSKGERPAYSSVLMFKILILQTLYNLSDEQSEFVFQDRLSFLRFFGLSLADKVPAAKTIWLFREQLAQSGAIAALFAQFDQHLSTSGSLANGGQIVDATIVPAPKQHKSTAEKEVIKRGGIPEAWQNKPAKLAQKDRDARWTLKYSQAKTLANTPAVGVTIQHDIAIPMFGYKNHATIDRTDNTASGVWADTAYRSHVNEDWLRDQGLQSQIQQKKPKGKPMPAHIARGNAQ